FLPIAPPNLVFSPHCIPNPASPPARSDLHRALARDSGDDLPTHAASAAGGLVLQLPSRRPPPPPARSNMIYLSLSLSLSLAARSSSLTKLSSSSATQSSRWCFAMACCVCGRHRCSSTQSYISSRAWRPTHSSSAVAPVLLHFRMASDGGSYSGSRPRKQRTIVQQTFPTHSASEGSVAASSTVGSVADIIDTIFRDLELFFRWDRTANADKEMLMYMSSMHRTWRGVLKKQNIADRNKANRSHQSMPYRKGRKSHYQLKDDFRLAHDREPNRVEIFKIDRCKELPDGNEQWEDDESRSQYERMIQLSTPSLDSESRSTPISAEEAFVSVVGKDQSGRIRCGGSRETRRTWYGTGEGPSSTDYQQHITNIENTLRMEVEELRTEARIRDLEMDEMWRELEQLRKRESEMDDIRR
ncbi:hypothetical protein Taro_039108, partial [Colocasia esculenta]|nr:hypothetical protein [Colocasia esculenta]